MSRTVSIKKVGAATVVDITDTNSQDEKRVYNRTSNVYSSGNSVVVHQCNPFSELRIPFAEIVNKLGANTADEYLEEIVKPANGFFNANVVL